jgi:hypothetical protein
MSPLHFRAVRNTDQALSCGKLLWEVSTTYAHSSVRWRCVDDWDSPKFCYLRLFINFLSLSYLILEGIDFSCVY